MPLLHLLEAASARAVTIIKVEALSEFDGEVLIKFGILL